MVESSLRVMENCTTMLVCAEIVNVPSGGVECNITLPLIFEDAENAGNVRICLVKTAKFLATVTYIQHQLGGYERICMYVYAIRKLLKLR